VADVTGSGILVFYRQITVKDVLYDPGEPVDGGVYYLFITTN
jgi:hypothetical protein